ncbi:histone deacetylase HD2 isoform 2 [Hordeum vulgare]|nr:histone deacetylase HD2 isoform 2 [Hordeum vulgare]
MRKTVRKEYAIPDDTRAPEARLAKKPGQNRAGKRIVHAVGRTTSMYEDPSEAVDDEEEEILAEIPPPKKTKLMADAMPKKTAPKPSTPKAKNFDICCFVTCISSEDEHALVIVHVGVVVKPGETVKCDPGDSHYHISTIALEAGKAEENVQVFVNTDDTRIMLGTLSVHNHPHVLADLVFKKEFELLHSSMTSNISFTGYKFDIMKRYPSTFPSSMIATELRHAFVFFNCFPVLSHLTHVLNKLIAPRPADAPSSIPEATVEETNTPGKQKADDKGKANAQNPIDGADNESSDQDVDYPRKKTKDDYNPMETPLNTPQGKRAKIATPTTGNKTGYVHVATPHPAAKQACKSGDHVHVVTPHPAVKQARKSGDRVHVVTPHPAAKQSHKSGDHVHVATPHPAAKQARKSGDHFHVATPHPAAKQARKSGDHVHVATPHPAAKHARKTPENSDDKSKQSAGHVCNSCNRQDLVHSL